MKTMTPRNVHRFKHKLSIQVGGLELELIHSPGESDDHIVAWWPKKKSLFAGKKRLQISTEHLWFGRRVQQVKQDKF